MRGSAKPYRRLANTKLGNFSTTKLKENEHVLKARKLFLSRLLLFPFFINLLAVLKKKHNLCERMPV